MFHHRFFQALFSTFLCTIIILCSSAPHIYGAQTDSNFSEAAETGETKNSETDDTSTTELTDTSQNDVSETQYTDNTEIMTLDVPSIDDTETGALETQYTDNTETERADTEISEDTFIDTIEDISETELPEEDLTEDISFYSSDSFYPEYIDGSITDGYYILKVSAASIEKSDATKVLQKALNTAAENATDILPYKIMVEPGTYTLTKSLYIYSNTYLYVDGVTFLQAENGSGNMLRVGKSGDVQTGYCYRNITVDGGASGGIWDENYHSYTVIKAGHAQNFTLKNITLQNTIDAHLMEAAGVNGFHLIDCTFQNQSLNSKLYYEAVQFDILLPKHISGYSAELLPNCNINITGCIFSNVPRGIGSHTMVLNSYMSNVQITNNIFKDTSSAAIQLMACSDTTVSNNIVINCPRGIIFYSIFGDCEGSFLASTIETAGGIASSVPVTYMVPPENQNIVISNNNITCGDSDKYNLNYENTGIYVGGYAFSSPQTPSDGDTIPAGDYYISGVTITGNTISTSQNGITLQNVRNAVVGGGNEITFTGSFSSCCGIQLRASSANCHIQNNRITGCSGTSISVNSSSSASSITGNVIDVSSYCGIYINDAAADSITGNTVTSSCSKSSFGAITSSNSIVNTISGNSIANSYGYGISISRGEISSIADNTISQPAKDGIFLQYADVISVSRNILSSCKENGILLEGCIVSAIASNQITASGYYGICQNGSAVTDIQNNTLQNCKKHSIVLYNSASTKNISGNSIVSGDAMGINIGTIGTNTNITSNTIKNCKTAQIYVNPNTVEHTVTITSNKLTGTSKVFGIRADSGKLSVGGNKISSCKIAIQLRNTVVGSIRKNTYSNNISNTVKIIDSTNSSSYKKYKNLSKPTSLKAKTISKSQIKLTWKKVSGADGYIIYRSTSPDNNFKKIATVKKSKGTTYTNKGLKKNKKYYYKIAAYKKSPNKNVTVISPDSKVVSRKTAKK